MSDKIVFGKHAITTLVAVTEEEQARGLMFKSWPPPVMSFPYDDAKQRKFWMHNTSSPLDIVFCRAGKVICIVEGHPFSRKLVGPDDVCDLVVELPRGMSAHLGVSLGTDVKLVVGMISLSKIFELKLSKRSSTT